MDDRSARNLPNLKSSREVFIKPLPPNERGRHKVAYTVAAVILALVLLALILLPALFPKGFHSVDYEPGPDANATAQVAFFYACHKEIRPWPHYHLKTKGKKPMQHIRLTRPTWLSPAASSVDLIHCRKLTV